RVSEDVEEMSPGDEFPARLQKLIDESHATIALIGKQWMPTREHSREFDPGDDWIVRELVYSHSSPIALPEEERFGLKRRLVLPLFADCDRGFDLVPII